MPFLPFFPLLTGIFRTPQSEPQQVFVWTPCFPPRLCGRLGESPAPRSRLLKDGPLTSTARCPFQDFQRPAGAGMRPRQHKGTRWLSTTCCCRPAQARRDDVSPHANDTTSCAHNPQRALKSAGWKSGKAEATLRCVWAHPAALFLSFCKLFFICKNFFPKCYCSFPEPQTQLRSGKSRVFTLSLDRFQFRSFHFSFFKHSWKKYQNPERSFLTHREPA